MVRAVLADLPWSGKVLLGAIPAAILLFLVVGAAGAVLPNDTPKTQFEKVGWNTGYQAGYAETPIRGFTREQQCDLFANETLRPNLHAEPDPIPIDQVDDVVSWWLKGCKSGASDRQAGRKAQAPYH